MPKVVISMPSKEKKRRAILARGILDIHEALLGYDDSTGMTMVVFAVALGWYEDNPMDASSIARAAHLPRSTTLRHLKVLERIGLVKFSRKGRWVFPVPRDPNESRLTPLYERLEGIMHRVGRHLSKLDT